MGKPSRYKPPSAAQIDATGRAMLQSAIAALEPFDLKMDTRNQIDLVIKAFVAATRAEKASVIHGPNVAHVVASALTTTFGFGDDYDLHPESRFGQAILAFACAMMSVELIDMAHMAQDGEPLCGHAEEADKIASE